jgi:hypothetical protein
MLDLHFYILNLSRGFGIVWFQQFPRPFRDSIGLARLLKLRCRKLSKLVQMLDEDERGGETDAPEEFCCPISLSIMQEPVVLSDGHTYEKEDLATWLQKNDTSPKTNEVLQNNLYFPNHNLKRAIERWQKENKRASRPISTNSEDSRSDFNQPCHYMDPSNKCYVHIYI